MPNTALRSSLSSHDSLLTYALKIGQLKQDQDRVLVQQSPTYLKSTCRCLSTFTEVENSVARLIEMTGTTTREECMVKVHEKCWPTKQTYDMDLPPTRVGLNKLFANSFKSGHDEPSQVFHQSVAGKQRANSETWTPPFQRAVLTYPSL